MATRSRITQALRRRLLWLLDGPELRALVRDEARASRMAGHVVFGPDPTRVAIAESAVLNDALLNVHSGRITIEEDAFLGHGVALLTGTHDRLLFGKERQRAIPGNGRDIVVKEGAWIASRATVIGPCVVGRHAVVAAGAVVTGDVAPYSIVAGVPARAVGTIPPGDDLRDW